MRLYLILLIFMPMLTLGVVHSEDAVNTNFDNLTTRVERAKLYETKKDYESAIREANDILALDPTSIDAAEIKIRSEQLVKSGYTATKKKDLAHNLYFSRDFYQAAKAYLEAIYFTDNQFSNDEKSYIAVQIVNTLKEDEILEVVHEIQAERANEETTRTKLAHALVLLATANITLAENESTELSDVTGSSTSNNTYGKKNLRRLASRIDSNDTNTALTLKGQAARLYLDGIDLEPNAFEVSEIIGIAKWLRSIGWLENSVEILKRLCDAQPLSIEARLELAQGRIALEQYEQAISAINDALSIEKENRDALLARAGALRKQRQYQEAIDQYQALLVKKNSFDARFGLASTYLSAGRKDKAAAVLAETETNDESQQEELYEISASLAKSTRPTVELSNSQYEDSDKNQLKTLGVTAKSTVGRYDLLSNYWRKSAVGQSKTVSTDMLSVGVGTNMTNEIKISGKLGATQANIDDSNIETIGQLKLDIQHGTAKIITNVSKETLTSTVSIIEKKIQMSQASVIILQPLLFNSNLKGIYSRKIFSDDNTANDFQASIVFRLNRKPPQLGIGYGYHYLDFDHSAKNFYFDPQGYSAYQIILTANWERAPFFMNLEIDFGQQKFSRNNYPGKQSFGYGNVTSGMDLSRHWAIGLTMEWSNAAVAKTETPEVYGDFMLGLKISYMF